jgi:hypothetical protein
MKLPKDKAIALRLLVQAEHALGAGEWSKVRTAAIALAQLSDQREGKKS